MYRMENIIIHDEEIELPKCMYRIRNPIAFPRDDEINLNISNQVIRFLKGPNSNMAELEQRQDELLKKLDFLFLKIKAISTNCNLSYISEIKSTPNVKQELKSEEVVLTVSPDHLPWYLNFILKNSYGFNNVTHHIHSSVPREKEPKIKSYIKKLPKAKDSRINLRLIFKCVSVDSELKLTSLANPIIGNVNILRYLSLIYPGVIPYDAFDFEMDNLLDVVHVLERTPEKNKEAAARKIFKEFNVNWVYGSDLSIVDIAVYNVIKQFRSVPKYVPKHWFENMENLCV